MNVVDSSAWLEYFADGPSANFFANAVEETGDLIVPTICLYEVFKVVLRQREESQALQAIAVMHQGRIAELTSPIALAAARLSIDKGLPMADSVILATSRQYEALLWTQDSDFEGLESVRFKGK